MVVKIKKNVFLLFYICLSFNLPIASQCQKVTSELYVESEPV